LAGGVVAHRLEHDVPTLSSAVSTAASLPGAVATVIDSQSVKAAETVGKDSRGYDGAKKIKRLDAL
jgi:hypothetical protein